MQVLGTIRNNVFVGVDLIDEQHWPQACIFNAIQTNQNISGYNTDIKECRSVYMVNVMLESIIPEPLGIQCF